MEKYQAMDKHQDQETHNNRVKFVRIAHPTRKSLRASHAVYAERYAIRQ
jgi:hypothetical protein